MFLRDKKPISIVKAATGEKNVGEVKGLVYIGPKHEGAQFLKFKRSEYCLYGQSDLQHGLSHLS